MDNQGFVNVSGWCVKCRKRTNMANIDVKDKKTSKRTVRICSGYCEICGTKMAKILKNDKNDEVSNLKP